MEGPQVIFGKDNWLSGLLKRDAYRLSFSEQLIRDRGRPDNTDSGDFVYLQQLQSQTVFIEAKVPATNLEICSFLEHRGFHLVDTNVSFWKEFDARPQPSDRYRMRMEFRWAEPADRAAVVDIARRSFQYSRFHLDPAIPNELANEIKAAWADNFFNGERGDEMAVATKRGRVIGFAQLLSGNEGSFTIDLIAVDPDFQKQGAASGMIRFAETMSIERWPHPGRLRHIRAGTQLVNRASISLYEHLGFRMGLSQYVFHFHNPAEYPTA